MLSYKRRWLGQGGGRLILMRSNTKGIAAQTVAGVPVLGGELGSFQQELEGMDMQEGLNGDGSVEHANDHSCCACT